MYYAASQYIFPMIIHDAGNSQIIYLIHIV
jgi:hypothetical protein